MPTTPPTDSPYDQSQTDYRPEDPELSDVLAEHARSIMLRMRTAMPARITQVTGDQMVEVQPLYETAYVNGTPNTPLPVIRSVPVLMPHGAGYSLRLPIAVGDTGLCVFSDRSLDAWLASDGTQPVDPQDGRAHSLNDAVFLPGLVPTSGQTQEGSSVTDLVLKAGTMQVRMQQAGRVKVGTSSAELLDLIDQTLTQALALAGYVQGLATQTGIIATQATAAATATGTVIPAMATVPSALTSLATQATQAQTTLTQIQTTLQSIKGT